MDREALRERMSERNERYRRELEDWYRSWLVDGFTARAAELWKRDYSSVDGYERSVAPNRARWRAILNPPDLAISGPLEVEPLDWPGDPQASFVRLPLGERLRAEAILAVPESDGPWPLIIAQHGIDSPPEYVFGLLDPEGPYRSYARALVGAGFAVLAPMNLCTKPLRNRISRLSELSGISLPGIELVRMQRLLDALLARPEFPPDRVGFWGLSLGGMAAQFWAPLEPRLKAIISAGWFSSRSRKMVVPESMYRPGLDSDDAHLYIHGWLTEFEDSDLGSLICPRPFLVQTGKADPVTWFPHVMEEFPDLRRHYERLGLADRCAIDLHEGGHEVHVESGIAWLRKWV
jgi:hypothetical protein